MWWWGWSLFDDGDLTRVDVEWIQRCEHGKSMVGQVKELSMWHKESYFKYGLEWTGTCNGRILIGKVYGTCFFCMILTVILTKTTFTPFFLWCRSIKACHRGMRWGSFHGDGGYYNGMMLFLMNGHEPRSSFLFGGIGITRWTIYNSRGGGLGCNGDRNPPAH